MNKKISQEIIPEVILPSDCDNSPKKKLIADFNTAFARADLDQILSFLNDDTEMEMTGNTVLKGKDAIRNFLTPFAGKPATKLEVTQIVTHGKEAASRGKMIFGENIMYFADFYEFNSAGSKKIKKITSFAIE